jgi:cyclophilin family peptidyl-prolyl cis-trans isomerase
VQFGDPQTRDMTKQAWWGRGFDAGSGRSIGVAEFNNKRQHKVGSVSMAHAGDAREADSQMFISLSRTAEVERSVHGVRPGHLREWTSFASWPLQIGSSESLYDRNPRRRAILRRGRL